MSSWTEDRIKLMVELWQSSHSASQIAERLGGVTRNSVIAKIHRLGLSYRGGSKQGNPRPKAKRKPRRKPVHVPLGNPIRVSLDAEPLPPACETDIPRVALVDLEPHHCRWPVNDPRDADFGFCGQQKVAGTPYCMHHAKRALNPIELKRRGIPVSAPTPSPSQADSTNKQLEDVS